MCLGIDKYQKFGQFKNAEKSARKMKDLLTNVGFSAELCVGPDLGVIKMGKILGDLRTKLDEAKNNNNFVLIYFSGSTYFENGNAQICPYDFDVKNVIETGQNFLNLRNRIMGTFNCKNVLFILDGKMDESFFDG